MIAMQDRQTGLEFKRRVAAAAPILEFSVFGAWARGDATVESDLDVFLVVDRIDAGLRERISEVAWEVGFENDVVLSTFVVTAEQLEHGPMGVSPIVQDREGRHPAMIDERLRELVKIRMQQAGETMSQRRRERSRKPTGSSRI